MPDVPTLKELGMNIVYEVVRGLLVPKGTPAPVRAKLEEACAKATKEPELRRGDEGAGHPRGVTSMPRTMAQFLAKIDGENKAIMTDLGLIKK